MTFYDFPFIRENVLALDLNEKIAFKNVYLFMWYGVSENRGCNAIEEQSYRFDFQVVHIFK